MPRLFAFLTLLLTLLVGLGPLEAYAKDELRIAVLELSGSLKAQELALMSDKVRAGVLDATQGRDIVVMSRENMAVLAKDMGLDLSCIEGACEVETGRNLGAAYVVSGALVRIQRTWICTLKVHDTRNGALLASGDARGKDSLELLDKIPPLARQLTSKGMGLPVSAVQGEPGHRTTLFNQEAAHNNPTSRSVSASPQATPTAIVVSLTHNWQSGSRGKTDIVEAALSRLARKGGSEPLLTRDIGFEGDSKIRLSKAQTQVSAGGAKQILFAELYLHWMVTNRLSVRCINARGQVVWQVSAAQLVANNALEMTEALVNKVARQLGGRVPDACIGR
jgi:TolB-like protein